MAEIAFTVATHPLLWIAVGLTLLLVYMQAHAAGKLPSFPPVTAQLRDRLGLEALPGFVISALAVLWLVFFFALIYSTLFVIYGVVMRLFPATEEQANDLRWSMLAMAGMVAALGGVIAVPFTFLRTKNARDNTEIQFRGQITDRINKAVEGLGATKVVKQQRRDQEGNLTYERHADGSRNYTRPVMIEVTEPNMEVRIGAIYALERIAQDSLRDHIQIMEILCAYVREKAPVKKVSVSKVALYKETIENVETGQFRLWDNTNPVRPFEIRPRADIETALKVLGSNRKPHWEKNQFGEPTLFNLNNSGLTGADLSHLDLSFFSFRRSDLTGASLQYAKTFGAVFSDAILDSTRFDHATFRHSKVAGSEFRNVDISPLILDPETTLESANFSGSVVRKVSIPTGHQCLNFLNEMFGDGSVSLPIGLQRPMHWPTEDLSFEDFWNRWRAWQDHSQN